MGEPTAQNTLRVMALHALRTGALVLALVALASCGGGGGEPSTEGGQAAGGGASGVAAQVLHQFTEPGSASKEFEALDWEGNLVRQVSRQASAPHGMKVVETTRSTAPGVCSSSCFFLIRDRPALTGDDLVAAKQGLDAATNEPTVILSLTDQGRRSFEELTRKVAQRGAEKQSLGSPPSKSFQHVALIVGDKVLSLPSIDFTQNPEGIDASSGVQIEGGFSIAEAQGLARALNPD